MLEKENGIELFENRKIRSVWDEESAIPASPNGRKNERASV
ncbi:hypothetical protein [uncultured Pyramidobacter sp.]|nr:hypothetical protein [uncultured Pyramidobacter sp.]